MGNSTRIAVGNAGIGMSEFARTIYRNKYAMDTGGGNKEEWPDTARRVAHAVMDPYLPRLADEVEALVRERKFLPAGRYLYAAGRRYPQCNNCMLFRAEDSREGWGELALKTCNSLMTGGGIGVVYSDVRPYGYTCGGLGGIATGPCSLGGIVNEQGRRIMQGGSRRSAIWAGLIWHHPDVTTFMRIKDWPDLVKSAKAEDFNFPAEMDMTNISVILDDDFFAAYRDPTWAKTYNTWGHPYAVTHADAVKTYWTAVASMAQTGEPGFSVDWGEHQGENCRNACLVGDTLVAVADGRGAVPIRDLVGTSTRVYSSTPGGRIVVGTLRNVCITRRNASVVKLTLDDGSSVRLTSDHEVMLANGSFVEAGTLVAGMRLMPFTSNIQQKYRRVGCGRKRIKQCWLVMGRRGGEDDGYDVHHINDDPLDDRVENLSLLSHGRHAALKMVGKSNPSVRNGYDKDWRIRQSIRSTGRNNGRYVDGSQTYCRPIAALHNTVAPRRVFSGTCKVCGEQFESGSENRPTCSHSCGASYGSKSRFSFRGGRTVVSIEPDGREDVYDGTVDGHHCFAIVTTPSPDLKYGNYAGMVVHNCCEITSSDDSDICNLGSLNLARFRSKQEFGRAVELGIAFLLCGTMYSRLPLEKMYRVREKNRRIGLGLMGLHEWLLLRGKRYGPDSELGEWMDSYVLSGGYASTLCDSLGISRSVATRSIAPTGTISIVAETTSGIEPIFAVAQKRRYLHGKEWKAQYIIDATARRLIASGVDPDLIEDSVTLAEDVERRMLFQSWLQAMVDHSISSTINLPPWGSSINNVSTVKRFGETLMKYLPNLRGMTAYPDGARGGQPLVRTTYLEAVKHLGVEFIDSSEKGGDSTTIEPTVGYCKAGGVCGE